MHSLVAQPVCAATGATSATSARPPGTPRAQLMAMVASVAPLLAGRQREFELAQALPDAVADARRRARQRLIGAAVLLAAGVIGFPLLFETQPRPIPVDLPIVMPDRNNVPPLGMARAPAATATSNNTADVASAVLPPVTAEMSERPGEQGRELPAPPPAKPPVPPAQTSATETGRPAPAPATAAPATAAATPAAPNTPSTVARPSERTASVPRAAAEVAAAVPPRTAPAKPAATTGSGAADAVRAQALLDGRAVPQEDVRSVVQVGAYTDPEKLRQARAKLEQLGFKTYTQVIEVNGERRTRVRVGPFSSRAEADKAANRIKAAGLPAATLTL
jgi:DedD protein